MRKSALFIIFVAFILLSTIEVCGVNFQNEKLSYTISYKWGLIHKDAGEATLSLTSGGNQYQVMLTAKTKPWADRLYQVRDTLKCTIMASVLQPLSYEKITHEKGEYKRDEIKYIRQNNTTIGKARRFRYDKGKESITENTFSATGPVYDMLSIFYYLRQLDFNHLDQNKVYTATIFSGKRKETIRIRSLGKEKIKLKDKSEKEAFHIRFNFTREGGKKSSEDMDTWISTDSRHIPLYLVGKLPVGEIRAYYEG